MSNDIVTDRQARALARARAVLLLCAGQTEGCSFSACAAATELPAPTLSRLLRSLVALGWIAHEADRYRVTDVTRAWARRLLGPVGIVELLRPVVQSLATTTGESAAFYEVVEGRVVLQAKYEMPDGTHYMHEGGQVPEVCRHGFAQLWMAHLDDNERLRRLRDTAHPPADEERFLRACVRMRSEGMVVERGEHSPAVARIAAPVHRPSAHLYCGSIGISLPLTGLKGRQSTLAAAVRMAAADAEQRLAMNREGDAWQVPTFS
ncbi:MAG: IclR family transcriptional regulator domain-containing protein [Planctomycetota bacterium]